MKADLPDHAVDEVIGWADRIQEEAGSYLEPDTRVELTFLIGHCIAISLATKL